MMAGTDGGWLSGRGLTLQEEFMELARAGPLQILRMATVPAPEYLGQAHRMGAVAVGHHADLGVLEANPLEHVEHLGRITAVVRGGLYHPRRELDQLRERVASGAASCADRVASGVESARHEHGGGHSET